MDDQLLLKIMLTYNLLLQNNSHVKHYLLFLKLYQHIRCKPRPGSTSAMAPDFSDKKGNHI